MAGSLLGYSLPLFLTLFATANFFVSAAIPEICKDSKKSTLLIVFGDSFFDVGYGGTELCLPSEKKPYGKSLGNDAQTGRFSDGLTVPDYIAKYLGLDNEGKVTAYNKGGFDFKHASSVSFAMAGAGAIQSAEGAKSLAGQVDTFLEKWNEFFGSSAKFANQQEETLYLFSIGTYDYLKAIKNIVSNENVRAKAEEVTAAIEEQVKKIISHEKVSGKRFAFMSVGHLPSLPVVQKEYYKKQDKVELLDTLANIHYENLTTKLTNLKRDHHDRISYSLLKYHNIIKAKMEERIEYAQSACCGDGCFKAEGCGDADKVGCNDPNLHVFWDGMHNTQHINQEIARIFWNGHKTMTYPTNLKSIAGEEKPKYDFAVSTELLQ